MPAVQRDGKEIAGIFIGDVHRSQVAPVSRAEKNTWMTAQNRVLDEVSKLQERYGAPVFIAGDLFDRWDSPAWIINETLAHLPKRCYGVPGNHDLPNHLYTEIHRSAYWTLVEAGKLVNLTPPVQHAIDHLLVSPFPCGFPVTATKDQHGLALNIALIHEYIWTEKTGRPGAPDTHRYGKWMKKLDTYDVAVFGDNHKGFLIQKDKKCTVLNCGTLMRRKSDEIGYTPSVGLMHSSGKVERHFLDVSKDEFSDLGREIASIEAGLSVDLSGFVEEMVTMRTAGTSWQSTVRDWVRKNKLAKDVETVILRAVEESK